MKYILLLLSLSLIGLSSSARTPLKPKGQRLIELAERTTEKLRREVPYLHKEDKREIRRLYRQISDVLEYGGGDPDPGPIPGNGYFCSAACKKSNGQADKRYSMGGTGEFEAEARQSALDKLRRKFSCGYGVVIERCERQSNYQDFTCASGCAKSNGRIDLRYAVAGKGHSLLEAALNAREAVRKKFSCGYGMVDGNCDSLKRASYCVAACLSSNGQPDLRYSKGARGESKVGAQMNAIDAVRRSYSCGYGIGIDSCQN